MSKYLLEKRKSLLSFVPASYYFWGLNQMLILKTKLQEKGISKLQNFSLCKYTNTLNDCIEVYTYREFRIWHKGHFHLSGVKVESCLGTRTRKNGKNKEKRNSQLSVCLPTHAAHTRGPPEQWDSLSAFLWMYQEGVNPNAPPSRSLHLYWNFSNMVPLPGRSPRLGVLFRCL